MLPDILLTCTVMLPVTMILTTYFRTSILEKLLQNALNKLKKMVGKFTIKLERLPAQNAPAIDPSPSPNQMYRHAARIP